MHILRWKKYIIEMDKYYIVIVLDNIKCKKYMFLSGKGKTYVHIYNKNITNRPVLYCIYKNNYIHSGSK